MTPDTLLVHRHVSLTPQVVVNSALTKSTTYHRATETFHQVLDVAEA